MKDREIALAGAGVFAVGTLFPILSLPIVGSMNFFANSSMSWQGLLIWACAGTCAYFFHKEDLKKARISTLVSAAMVLLFLLMNFFKLSSAKKEVLSSLKDDSFSGIVKATVNNIGLSWGWIIIIAGLCGMLYVAYKEEINKFLEKRKKKI